MTGSNWKTPLLVLLTIAVLVLGALLPGILANIHEGSYEPGFAAMNSVELQLRSHGSISLKDAISLVANSTNAVEVDEAMTTRTKEEILDLTGELLQPYLDREVILAPGLDVPAQAYSCIPSLSVSSGDSAGSTVFWTVLILFDEEEPALQVAIEDRSGAIIALGYNYSKAGIDGKDYLVPDETLKALCEIYLAGLGEEFSGYTPTVTESYTDADGVTAQHWNISWESAYGPAGIGFDVWEHGCSIGFF